MELPKNAQKSLVLDIVGEDAGSLLVSQDLARQALARLGVAEESAEAVLAEVLEEIGACYRKQYVEKGKGPKLKVTTIVLPK